MNFGNKEKIIVNVLQTRYKLIWNVNWVLARFSLNTTYFFDFK